jgi:hypothetical protein
METSYQKQADQSSPRSAIIKRRAEIPSAYRGIYDRAMSGQSRQAAMHSFCLECMGWSREEVRRCTAVACPLYPYRPFKSPQDGSEGEDIGAESTNAGQEVE